LAVVWPPTIYLVCSVSTGALVSTEKFSGCLYLRYCGAVHQKAHWKEHKPQCKHTKQALALLVGEVDARFQWSPIDSDDPTAPWTHLALAVYGLEPLARHLLDLGADKELADDQGRTSLCVACIKGMSEVAKPLAERGTGVNAKTNDGRTALMFACYEG
jgi:hypothetical protein